MMTIKIKSNEIIMSTQNKQKTLKSSLRVKIHNTFYREQYFGWNLIGILN